MLKLKQWLLASVVGVGPALAGQAAAKAQDGMLGAASRPRVVINGRALTEEDIRGFQEVYGVRPGAGSYWYDPRSGLFGSVGTPALGQMYPGHDLGPLAANASAGDTGLFVNGRELPEVEWLALCRILGGALAPGRYTLDANGDMGIEGEPYPRVNLLAAAQAAYAAAAGAGGGYDGGGYDGGGYDGGGSGGGGSGGGDNFWSSSFACGNSSSDGTCGYVSIPGGGSVTWGMD